MSNVFFIEIQREAVNSKAFVRENENCTEWQEVRMRW